MTGNGLAINLKKIYIFPLNWLIGCRFESRIEYIFKDRTNWIDLKEIQNKTRKKIWHTCVGLLIEMVDW